LAGIKHKSVSFEVMRWTAAVRDYRTGMAPETLRKKLGLSKISWRETGMKIRQLAGPAL
jgi:integrase/recombinase XerD